MVVQDPVKVTLTNYPEGQVEWFDCPLNPAEPEGATRKVPFSGELYIDRADFMEDAPKKFFRLKPDGEVRLKYTYIIKCNEVIKDEDGRIVELKCTYDPTTHPTTGEWRSVKGTIHWVSVPHAKEIELRNYDRLFTLADMSQVPEDKDYKDFLNPESLVVGEGWAEPALLDDASGIAVQFERTGYYVKDKDSTPEKAVFPGRGMKRVFQIGDVAGVEALAQQEGGVDVVAEEDGLEAQLVAGDAGREALPPGLVQGLDLIEVVLPVKEVVLVESRVAGEALGGPFPVQPEGRPGIDLVLQVTVPKFLIHTVPVWMLHLREGDLVRDEPVRDAVEFRIDDAQVRVQVHAVLVLRKRLVRQDLRIPRADDRVRTLERDLPQLPHPVLPLGVREADVIPVRRHGGGLLQAVVAARQAGVDHFLHRCSSLPISASASSGMKGTNPPVGVKVISPK